MLVAGIDIPEPRVLELALMLRRADFAIAADRLEDAVASHRASVALTIDDRVAILNVLKDDPPAGLEALPAAMLNEHVSRRAEGL